DQNTPLTLPNFQKGPPMASSRLGGQHAGVRRGNAGLDDSAPASKRFRTTGVSQRGKPSSSKNAGLGPIEAAPPSTRRSTRLLMSTGKLKYPPPARDNRRKTTNRSTSVSDAEDNPADALSPSSGSIPQSPRSDSTENLNATSNSSQEAKASQLTAERYVFDMMKLFAKAQYHLSRYESKAAIQCVEKLPQSQRMSPSAMVMIAKAYYELVEYIQYPGQAERAFKAARKLDPYRLWDMDLYSTLLWHLRRNAQLSFLAQELLNINSKSPEAWIAVGNCFSLQKEHSQALVCFQRAAEMDPFCAYAYTLSGHEALVAEDVRKAIILFQTALGHDGRHYNAWELLSQNDAATNGTISFRAGCRDPPCQCGVIRLFRDGPRTARPGGGGIVLVQCGNSDSSEPAK
ncbi:15951_t:CDS:2, partial [Acaulospora colombiana]